MNSRIAIGTCGVVSGLMTTMPNIMLSDSGTPTSQWAATIGLSASATFIGGGLVGAVLNKRIFLLPGLVLQIGAFVVPSTLSKFGLIESDKEYYKRTIFFKNNSEHSRGPSTGNPQITYFPDEIKLENNKNKVKDDFDPCKFLGGTGNPEKTFFAEEYEYETKTKNDEEK